MYYKEEVIDGVLCFKNTPKGEWIPLDAEQLTRKIVKLQHEVNRLTHKLEIASNKLHEKI